MKHKSQDGVSIIEAVLALGILGIVAVGVHQYILTHKNQVQSAKNTSASSRFGGELLDGAKRLLADVKSPRSGKNVEGICRWTAPAFNNPGVGTVNIVLPALSMRDKLGFSSKTWAEKFPGWNVLSSTHGECKTVDTYSRCLTPESSTVDKKGFEEARGADFVAQVSLVPIYVNPRKGYFANLNLKHSDRTVEPVADIGFKAVVDLYYGRSQGAGGEKVREKKTFETVFWAPAAGTCDADIGRRQTMRMSLSGLGASDPEGLTLYNIPKYERATVPPLDIDFLRSQAQAGQLDPNGQFLSTNRNANIAVSCNESVYQCPNLKSSGRVYADVNIKMRLNYNPFNNLAGHASEMTLFPKIKFAKGSQDAVESTRATTAYYFDGNTRSESAMILNGSHALDVNLSNGKGSASNMCRVICQDSNNYNTAGRSTYDRFVPVVEQRYAGFSETITTRADASIGCTACFMKNCAQIGLGTFGPMVKQPYQPIDSNVPECWVNENDSNTPFSQSHFVKQGSFSGEGCVAAQLLPGDRLALVARSCNTSLPVMCFNYGSFSLAQNISLSNRSIRMANFDGAPDACFEMGREFVQRRDLDSLIGGSLDRRYVLNSNYYSFVNIANQGLFIAPQISEDIESYRKWAETQSVSSNILVWTNLRYKDDVIYAPPPAISMDRDAKELSLYYDKQGRLTSQRTNSSLGELSPSTNNSDHFLFFHNMRFKGAIRVAGNQSVAYRVMCVKDGKPVITKNTTQFVATAPNLCAGIGAKFEAPVTPIRWVNGLMTLQPLSKDYPSPDLSIMGSVRDMKPVWVSNTPALPGK